MSAFTVETDTLRATALLFDGTARTAVGRGAPTMPGECGHSGLASAVAGFVARLDEVWSASATTVDAVARGLSSTASVYEAGDESATTRLRPGGGSF